MAGGAGRSRGSLVVPGRCRGAARPACPLIAGGRSRHCWAYFARPGLSDCGVWQHLADIRCALSGAARLELRPPGVSASCLDGLGALEDALQPGAPQRTAGFRTNACRLTSTWFWASANDDLSLPATVGDSQLQ